VRSLISFISNEYDKIKCLKKSVVGYIVGWVPEFSSCLGYIVSCGYPTRTHTHTRGNSVAHVCLLVFNLKFSENHYPQILATTESFVVDFGTKKCYLHGLDAGYTPDLYILN
jgi:hypothetical protein